jgi:hypothetical protein
MNALEFFLSQHTRLPSAPTRSPATRCLSAKQFR